MVSLRKQTPDEWLLADFDRRYNGAVEWGSNYKRLMFELIDDHKAGDCSYQVSCVSWSGQTRWPEPLAYSDLDRSIGRGRSSLVAAGSAVA